MKSFKLYLFFITFTLAFISCRKVIDIKVNTSASQIVIEGNISNNRGTQYVKVSRSVAYTNTNTYPAVSGADVRIADNAGNSWKFIETSPGNYSFGPLRGQTGRTYTLTVNAEGKTYTSASVMPAFVPVDSLTLTRITFGSTSRKLVAVNFTDPRGVENQYRYIMRVNGRQSNRIYVEDDRLTDGNLIKEELFPDVNDDDEDDDLQSGDKVEVEIQNIDKKVFNYWYSLRQQSRGGPGGGVTPGNPPSNLNNGALGYFSAHTYQVYHIDIP